MMKPHDLPGRLVSDTYRTIMNDEARRQVHFRWILKILIAFLMATSVIEFFNGGYTISLLTLALSASFFLYYWIVYVFKYRGVLIVSALMTIECAIVYSFALINGTSDGFAAIWILIMPPISILLMGRKIGLISNTVLFSLLLFFLWTPWGKSMLHYNYSTIFASRLPLIYALLLIIVIFTESLRDITVRQLRESRQRIESIYQLQYSHIQERIDEARKTRHDLRHHLMLIDSYLQEGKIEDAQNYIRNYYGTLPFEESMTFCEHHGTNALLTYCSQRAKQENVEKNIHVQYPKQLPIPDEDLTVVFGNLLENALDASISGMREDPEFIPKISVNGSYDGSAVLFAIRNRTLHQAVQNSQNIYLSTKHAGTGIGIASVQGVVDKYNGTLRIEQKDGEFIVNLVMYAPE